MEERMIVSLLSAQHLTPNATPNDPFSPIYFLSIGGLPPQTLALPIAVNNCVPVECNLA
ncbi:hypothetical protein DPMN_090804 [Dreissena polymorpha]|uniref:Uncharacterized protein n=1 Tax=Dreissena polymorpha TaxID=45954 RepID=A0A9D4L0W5_DREPO|nr:hypothetical protein DPMN_090804 [Dreissena polymorpha]